MVYILNNHLGSATFLGSSVTPTTANYASPISWQIAGVTSGTSFPYVGTNGVITFYNSVNGGAFPATYNSLFVSTCTSMYFLVKISPSASNVIEQKR